MCASFLSLATCKSQDKKVELKTEKDSVSYALGILFGSNIKKDFKDVDTHIIGKAIADVYENKPLKITTESANMYLSGVFQKNQEKAGAENEKAANDFLEQNKTKPGVITLPSGLQYKVIEEGKGAKPSANDKVKVHYHGTLTDGTVFDSSVERGEPITFSLDQVIPGWTEGLQLMSEGSTYMLFIPPALGYGPRGAGNIGPNSVLIFEVQLLEVIK